MSEPTIFEKIIAKEVPAAIVYEDENTLAFLDKAPVHPGHTLVVPKIHSRNLLDIKDMDRNHLFATVQKISKAIIVAGIAAGVNIVINNEPEAGQVVFHTHVHVIPRHKGDNALHWSHNPNYDVSRALEIAEQIKVALQSKL